MSWAYLGCLLFSLVGMAILDRRHRLFWFADPKRAAIVHGIGLAAFLVWDGAGILTGIFHRGDSPYMIGIDLAPELPLEEVVFLAFLCWLTMNLYTGCSRTLRARADRAASKRVAGAGTGGRVAGGRVAGGEAPRTPGTADVHDPRAGGRP